jgi:hypothetical protein
MATGASIARMLRVGALALAALFLAAGVFVSLVLPYRLWDSLAFGSWSRTIAEGDPALSGQPALYLQRPLFYVAQGLAWRWLDDGEWLGRLLSLSFAALLAACVWALADRLSSDPAARALLSPLALATVLACSVVATYAAAGMTDVPVAALVAATGAAAWSDRIGYPRAALVAALACATILAKPTGAIALAGLGAALAVLFERRALRVAAALASGAGLALAYSVWQASRLNDSVSDFLTAGNDAFWRERGAAARWDAVLRAEWLGAGLRLLVLYALAHSLLRLAGARPAAALGGAAAVAIGWSLTGPVLADGSFGHPFDGSVAGLVAWLVLASAMTAAPFRAGPDPVPRRVHLALLVWLGPMALAWAWQRADEARHLAPAWAPIVLVTAAGLVSLSVSLARFRPRAVLVPAAAVAVLALATVPSVDGLGRDGWRGLLDLGWSGWTSRAERENYAYGPFSYELNAAREHVVEDERMISSNGRLSYFFPGRVTFGYPTTCAELSGARFFSFLASGESLEFAQAAGQPTDPLAWLQCSSPPLTLVSEHPGIYAAYVVGDPPARPPAPEECGIVATPSDAIDAVFGDRLTLTAAKELYARALATGYTGGLELERTGCSTFRVVVTGIPGDPAVQDAFRRQVVASGFEIAYAAAVRYPEVAADVVAVP